MVLLGAPNAFAAIFENYLNLLNYNSKVINALEDLVIKRFGSPPNAFSTAKKIFCGLFYHYTIILNTN